jgi:peptidoglycan hydrolase-like protein with peptidoglycan-binding domain
MKERSEQRMTIKQVQQLLNYLGYDPGAVDGVDGRQTQAAVRRFQGAEGLTVDGIAGEQTQIRLKDAVWQDRFAKDNTVPSSGQPPDKTGTFWDSIKYFTRDEPYIACPCGRCGGFPVEPAEKLMRLADAVREAAGKPMVPTSTVRCDAHNAEVGGVATSRHRLGHAMDFVIPGMTANQILTIVRKQKNVVYCYAIDGSAVHMDIGN